LIYIVRSYFFVANSTTAITFSYADLSHPHYVISKVFDK